MFKTTLIAASLAALQSTAALAVPVTPGDTIRGAYTFSTSGAVELAPRSFLLRLSSFDLFGDGDAVGIRLLDGTLTPLVFSQFAAQGTGLDSSIGISINPSDFLPGAPGTPDPTGIPSTGFVDIIGIAGSFDVLALDILSVEVDPPFSVLKQTRVSSFEVVTGPTTIPLPASILLLLGSLGGLFAVGLARNPARRNSRFGGAIA